MPPRNRPPRPKPARRPAAARPVVGAGGLPASVELTLGLDDAQDPAALREATARALKRPADELPELTLVRRSIDARRHNVRFKLEVTLGAPPAQDLGAPLPVEARALVGGAPVVIVGDGPAGLFCAYELARHGVASVVVDRGKPVQPRRRDLALLNREGRVDDDSNYCFGEGGAGTYSDGKLYTRTGEKAAIRDVLETLTLHGAPDVILTDARPHIGSNKLPKVITALRERLEGLGVVFRFGARVAGLDIDPARHVRGVRLSDGEVLPCAAVVLATGHSARDIYTMLDEQGVQLVPKPFALGVRIEHPQPMINQQQYGRSAGHPALPAAYYRVAETVDQRGVFSFCMCPGGFIVPAATEAGGQVVNGMSLSRRDSPFANSGLVVAVEPSDWERAGFKGPMGGVAFQRVIEEAAFQAGGGGLVAPATRASDFRVGRSSSTVPKGSYQPGFFATDIAPVLDASGVPLASRLRTALGVFERRMPGYGGNEAVLVGVESRTSSPVRIPRDPDTLQSPDVAGLYPCGEGGGFAGGIVSAALDGMRVARVIAQG
ncbi:MAG: FAD-dependent monooxygenase [Polyangiales bacterium]|nr:FAD-dependent oxidoreductase [Myxococcales bacterium]MCB9657529.1 FAD-dependent oxidoreductase [Sandaracinaceae bacterium]